MGNAIHRLQQRKKALNTVSELMTHPEMVVVIHYSCESFYDRPDGSSPRITSIAVRNLASGQTTSFSIHQMAERQKVSRDEIEQNLPFSRPIFFHHNVNMLTLTDNSHCGCISTMVTFYCFICHFVCGIAIFFHFYIDLKTNAQRFALPACGRTRTMFEM